MPATYYVSPSGSNGNPGTSGLPFQTIQYAANQTFSGDTVLVQSGVYSEEVVPPRGGVIYKNAPGATPIVDGGNVRTFGFRCWDSGVTNLRIEGFEIRNTTSAGVRLQGGLNRNHVVTGCHIHHIGTSHADEQPAGVYLLTASSCTISYNRIHHIGPGFAGTGVWSLQCRDNIIDHNDIWDIRKECIRSWMGLNVQVTNNRCMRSWCGLAPNNDAAGLWANNYISYCVMGINPKHTNDPYTGPGAADTSCLAYWGYTEATVPNWTRIWHNTVYRSSNASVVLAINADPGTGNGGYMNQLDLRNNIFEGRGGEFIWDWPAARTSNIIVNYNVYSTDDPPPFVWETDYTYGQTTKTLAQLRTDFGWEINGRSIDPQLNNVVGGDLDYPNTSPAVSGGASLASLWGSQVGARGLPAPAMTYALRSMTALSSKSTGFSVGDRAAFCDEKQETYLFTGNPPGTNGATNEWVIFDFGSAQTFNAATLVVFAHARPSNVQAFTIETSNDQASWTQIYAFTNPDSSGAAYSYELPGTFTARYLRYTAVSNFGEAYMVLADFSVGLLADVTAGTSAMVSLGYHFRPSVGYAP